MRTTRDLLADELRSWVYERNHTELPRTPGEMADALLPIVRAIAAEELEAEAAYDDAAPDEQYARYLFANRLRVRAANLRADALDSPSPSRP